LIVKGLSAKERDPIRFLNLLIKLFQSEVICVYDLLSNDGDRTDGKDTLAKPINADGYQ